MGSKSIQFKGKIQCLGLRQWEQCRGYQGQVDDEETPLLSAVPKRRRWTSHHLFCLASLPISIKQLAVTLSHKNVSAPYQSSHLQTQTEAGLMPSSLIMSFPLDMGAQGLSIPFHMGAYGGCGIGMAMHLEDTAPEYRICALGQICLCIVPGIFSLVRGFWRASLGQEQK
jgi:hypothetical protein